MTDPNEPMHPIPGGGAIALGLTKREYFAAQTLQAILSSGDCSRVSFEEYATCAVHHADALIATLDRIPAADDGCQS